MLEDRDYMRQNGEGWGRSYSYRSPRKRSVVFWIILINVIVFLLQKVLIEIDGEDGKINEIITAALKLNVVSLKENFQILRGFTYMFAHGSFWHLFFNMWGLYLFGKLLEERLGSRGFLILYFFSGLVGAFFWIVFHWSPPQDHISVIGASGAVCGLMMAAALLFPNIRILLIIPPIPMKLRTFVIIFMFLELYMELTRTSSNIAHSVHLAGFLGGLIYVKLLMKDARSSYWGRSPDFVKLSDRIQQTFISFFRSKSPPGTKTKKKDADPATDSLSAIDGSSGRLKINRADPATDSLSAIDPILDKIGKHGMDSLSKHEKALLEQARKKLKER